jgi:hypothetical protein
MKTLALAFIFSVITVSCFAQTSKSDDRAEDRAALSKLNAQFIKNFINHDTIAHNKIIHNDFICIENNGEVANRKKYMKNWSSDYPSGNFTSFSYKDEFIRFFGDVALVRSQSVYTKIKNGKTITGNSVYTDTYIKENGRWWCVQAQITPVTD